MSNEPISSQWYEAAQEWVALESAASLLEDTRSAVLAQRIAMQGDIPVSRAEHNVKATAEWRDHLGKVNAARTAANKAKIKAEWLKMKAFEAASQEATERTQARL